MNNIEKYLNLNDVLNTLNKNTYEYQTLNNVMVSLFDELSQSELKQLNELIEF